MYTSVTSQGCAELQSGDFWVGRLFASVLPGRLCLYRPPVFVVCLFGVVLSFFFVLSLYPPWSETVYPAICCSNLVSFRNKKQNKKGVGWGKGAPGLLHEKQFLKEYMPRSPGQAEHKRR